MDPIIRKKIKQELFKQDKDLATFLESQEMSNKLDQLDKLNKLDKLDEVISELKKDKKIGLDGFNITTIKGDKGDKGEAAYTPIKGKDYFDGYTPVKDVDYFNGKDGVDGKNGKDGLDGIDGKSIKGPAGKDGSPDTPKQIVDKLNTLEEVLESKVIKGFPTLKDFINKLKKDKSLELKDIKGAPLDMRWHGGGITGQGVLKITVGLNPPSNPTPGDLWVNTN